MTKPDVNKIIRDWSLQWRFQQAEGTEAPKIDANSISHLTEIINQLLKEKRSNTIDECIAEANKCSKELDGDSEVCTEKAVKDRYGFRAIGASDAARYIKRLKIRLVE